ncbi:hypothetical protein M3Y99_01885000 [Aphelenchoides fujianensis]|nr:hypothetical protein M3Y99_01885000 [Aphelenchoides fujianensis]
MAQNPQAVYGTLINTLQRRVTDGPVDGHITFTEKTRIENETYQNMWNRLIEMLGTIWTRLVVAYGPIENELPEQ